MNNANKQRVRDEIAKDKSWVVIDGILGEDVSPLAWNKKCEIIYEDMDCKPCKCKAIYRFNSFGPCFFTAVDGPAKDNVMSGVIAYRILEE